MWKKNSWVLAELVTKILHWVYDPRKPEYLIVMLKDSTLLLASILLRTKVTLKGPLMSYPWVKLMHNTLLSKVKTVYNFKFQPQLDTMWLCVYSCTAVQCWWLVYTLIVQLAWLRLEPPEHWIILETLCGIGRKHIQTQSKFSTQNSHNQF